MSQASQSALAGVSPEGELPTGPPPARFRSVRWWSLRSVGDIGRVRRDLRAHLSSPHADPRPTSENAPEHLLLAASELAANALVHGQQPSTLHLMSDGREYLLDVADHDTTTSPVVPQRRPVGAGGFGLHIVRALSRRIGWHRSGAVKHVWATFPALQ